MFGIGMPELILILAIALMVIGPKKLPDLAKSLGRAMREFKKATSELKDSLELDSEVKEVRATFDEIKSGITDTAEEEKTETGSDSRPNRQVADLEKDYSQWQENRSIEPANDAEATTTGSSEEIAGAPEASDPDASASDEPPEDEPSEKDR